MGQSQRLGTFWVSELIKKNIYIYSISNVTSFETSLFLIGVKIYKTTAEEKKKFELCRGWSCIRRNFGKTVQAMEHMYHVPAQRSPGRAQFQRSCWSVWPAIVSVIKTSSVSHRNDGFANTVVHFVSFDFSVALDVSARPTGTVSVSPDFKIPNRAGGAICLGVLG